MKKRLSYIILCFVIPTVVLYFFFEVIVVTAPFTFV